jgi:2-keto-3-deoxy-6-phosphogluconate aldolase
VLRDEDIIPSIQSRLRHNILEMPKEIREASGILVFGRRIKSLVFTTDLAIIKNCDADAVFAVYPFTPQQSISDAIIRAAAVPVFTGIGGGITKGLRTVRLAKDAESQGAYGVVMNMPTSNRDLRAVSAAIDIPVVITVTGERTDVRDRLRHGASIINVAAGARTPEIVRLIDAKYPDVPIIASGGNTPESIRATIKAGANAITYTPPSSKQLFSEVMEKYREPK